MEAQASKYGIMLSVISILTVIVTAVGVSVAYFTGSISGVDGDVTVTTTKLGAITFDGGADFSTSDGGGSNEIEPGWVATKTFSIEAAPSPSDQIVYINIDYTNGFKDLKLKVEGTVGEGDNTNGAKGEVTLEQNVTGSLTNETATKVTANLVTVTLPASTNTVKYTYKLTAEFPDTHENQNYDQGKKFEATLYGTLVSNDNKQLYYTYGSPNGTTTKPTPSPAS